MSNSNWGYVAAIGGLAFLLSGAAPVAPAGDPKGQPQTAPSPAADSKQAADNLTRYERESLTVDRRANGIAQTANGVAESQRFYAFLQVILGCFGVALTGFAAFFAYRATHWAKEAARQSKRSADADNLTLKATTDGLAEARKTNEAQLTAYFSLINFEYTLPIGEGSQPTFSIHIDNKGQTPAKAFRHVYECTIADKDLSFVPIPASKLAAEPNGLIGPAQPIHIIGRKFEASRQDIDAVLSGEKWVYLTTAIEFKNVNGRHIRVDFGRHSKRDLREGSRPLDASTDIYFSSSWHWEERDISQGDGRQDS